MPDKEFLKGVLAGLKGHPEAILAFALAVLACFLLWRGSDPFVAVGVPAAFYLIYLARMWMHDAHKERLAQMEVNKIEITKGAQAREKTARALAKTPKGVKGE